MVIRSTSVIIYWFSDYYHNMDGLITFGRDVDSTLNIALLREGKPYQINLMLL